MRLVRRRLYRRVALWVLILTALLGWAGNVDNTVTAADRYYGARILGGMPVRADDSAISFEAEVRLIQSVQRAVLEVAPGQVGIPHGSPREPGDLYREGGGQCYDRSRTIEKLLRGLGFRTRHVAVYGIPEGWPALAAALLPNPDSHSITEVWTRRGWLVVDSNDAWVSLDASGAPLSLQQIRGLGPGASIEWHDDVVASMNRILSGRFTHVYGLYSRHGGFYPPFTPVPDVNYGELLHNLSS